MSILELVATIPWAFLLFPVHEHFNWNYQFGIAYVIRWVMGVLLFVQFIALVALIIN